jgi:hypothetical protein
MLRYFYFLYSEDQRWGWDGVRERYYTIFIHVFCGGGEGGEGRRGERGVIFTLLMLISNIFGTKTKGGNCWFVGGEG